MILADRFDLIPLIDGLLRMLYRGCFYGRLMQRPSVVTTARFDTSTARSQISLCFCGHWFANSCSASENAALRVSRKGRDEMEQHETAHALNAQDKRRKKAPQWPKRSHQNQEGQYRRDRHGRYNLRTVHAPSRAVRQTFHLRQVHRQI